MKAVQSNLPQSRPYPQNPILMIDDDECVLRSQARFLEDNGITNVISCTDAREVLPLLGQKQAEAVLLDLTMPHLRGEDLLAAMQVSHPYVPVIVITASGDVDTAVRCMKAGAQDYMVKPVEPTRFLGGIRRILELAEGRRAFGALSRRVLDDELERPETFRQIVTSNRRMKSIFLVIEAAAVTGLTFLLTGETGTGKELLARAVHDASGRTGPFVPMNIAGIDDTMFSDTLFGHTKGAYTGAVEARKGILAQAAGGTVLLDEIGDLNAASQVKLLRLLESSEYYPLGSDTVRRTDARFVVSTHQDLAELVRFGRFRRDLYFRINAQAVKLPPLRERKEDIPLLLEHFLREAGKQYGKERISYPPQLVTLLGSYHFPGNIRELRSMTFAAVSRHRGGILSMDTFRDSIGGELSDASAAADSEGQNPSFGPVLPSIKRMTDSLIGEALKRADGNLSVAAGLLGITHQAMSKRLKRKEEKKEP